MIGETISHYRIIDPLGSGGMGQVFRAEDTRLGRQVALKFLTPDLVKDPASLERFQREARAASSLNHPGICTIYDVGEYNGQPFLVMELLEGQTLRERTDGRAMPTAAHVVNDSVMRNSFANHLFVKHRKQVTQEAQAAHLFWFLNRCE